MIGSRGCVFSHAATEFAECHDHDAIAETCLLEINEKRFERATELPQETLV